MPSPYSDLQRYLARGWNTWNTRSVLSHVLLPAGLALNLGIKEYRNGFFSAKRGLAAAMTAKSAFAPGTQLRRRRFQPMPIALPMAIAINGGTW